MVVVNTKINKLFSCGDVAHHLGLGLLTLEVSISHARTHHAH